MDFLAVVDQLLSHVKAAGADLDNPIDDVAFAHPLPTGRCIRIYYSGEAPPPHFGEGRVLNGEMIAEVLTIVAFWPLSNTRERYAETIEGEIRALKHGIKTRIFADSQLGGRSTDLVLGLATADWSIVAGTVYRILEIEVITETEEYPLGA
jgi:hypothetical protein